MFEKRPVETLAVVLFALVAVTSVFNGPFLGFGSAIFACLIGILLSLRVPRLQDVPISFWLYFLVVSLITSILATPLFRSRTRDVNEKPDSGIRKKDPDSITQDSIPLKEIAEAIPTLVWSCRRDGTWEFVNSQWLEFTGANLEMLNERGCEAFFHPEDVALVTGEWQKHLDKPGVFEVEARLRRADGDYRWVRTKFAPDVSDLTSESKGGEGKVKFKRWILASSSIEQLKMTEKALSVKEYEARAVSEAIPSILVYVDCDHKVVFWNKRFAEWIGGKQSLAGTRLNELFGVAGYLPLQSAIEDAFLGHTSPFSEVLTIKSTQRYVKGHIAPDLTAQGAVRGAVLIFEEQKQAGEEKGFQELANAMPILLWTKDAAGQILFANEATLDMLGLTLKEMQRAGDRTLIHPLDVEEYEKRWRNSLKESIPFNQELRLRNDEGVSRWYQVQVSPVSDGIGEAHSWVVNAVDIHQRVLRERKQRQSTQSLVAALSAAEMAMFDLNCKTKELGWGKELDQFYGFDQTKKASRYEYWRNMIHPDDLEHVESNLLSAADGWIELNVECRVIRNAADIRWIHIKGRLLRDEGGQPLKIIGIHSDVTERRATIKALRESEAFYQTIGEAVPDFLWSCDVNLQTDFVNRRWYEYTGLTLSELRDKGWQYPYHPDDIAKVELEWKKAQEQTRPVQVEFRYRSREGTYEWFMCRSVPILDANGKVTKWVGTSTNIQQIKQAEKKLDEMVISERDARQEAERASALKDEFLALLSQELRDPMNAILSWSQVLKREQDNPLEFSKGLEIVERNAQAQAQLIDDLLDMSQIVSGRVVLDRQQVELVQLIRDTLNSIRPAAQQKGVRIVFENEPSRAGIEGDSYRLQQIVWNLVVSAVKLTPRAGKVSVALQVDHTEVVLSVSTDGRGFSREMLPYVFDRLAPKSGLGSKPELGLGLVVAKELVQLHQGMVSATSQGEFKGCTLAARLPRGGLPLESELESQIEVETQIETESSEQSISKQSLEGVNILVLENQKELLDNIRRPLEKLKANVYGASSPTEALEIHSRVKADLIIGDISILNGSGNSFMDDVRSMDKNRGEFVPAVALTPEKIVTAPPSGFQGVVSQQFRPEALTNLVIGLVQAN